MWQYDFCRKKAVFIRKAFLHALRDLGYPIRCLWATSISLVGKTSQQNHMGETGLRPSNEGVTKFLHKKVPVMFQALPCFLAHAFWCPFSEKEHGPLPSSAEVTVCAHVQAAYVVPHRNGTPLRGSIFLSDLFCELLCVWAFAAHPGSPLGSTSSVVPRSCLINSF